MIFLYIFGGIVAVIALYFLFLWICSRFVDPNRLYDTHSPFYRFLLNCFVGKLLWFCRIKVHVSGMDQIPKHKRLLFVSNHMSNFDPIVTWHTLRKWNMAYISKPSNFNIPIFGRIVRRCGFLPIDRENARNAMTTILSAAQLLRSEAFSVGVYPEGTRSKTGQLLPFHNGVFKIAQKAEADIVVLCLSGTERIHRRFPWHRSHVYLDVLAVLPAQQIKSQKTEQIGQEVRDLLLSQREKRN